MLFKRDEVLQRVEEVPAWIKIAAALLVLTYSFATTAIQYVYGCVITTLTTIESDSTTAILRTSPTPSNDDPDAPLPPYTDKEEDVKAPLIDPSQRQVQQEILLIKDRPITSSLRGTIKHLRAQKTSGFRGFGVAILYFIALHWSTNLLSLFARYNPIWRGVAFVLAQVLLTRLSLLWMHIVIAAPHPTKRWYQRAVPRSVARKVMLPTLAVALAQLAIPAVPALAFLALGTQKYFEIPLNEQSKADHVAVAVKMMVVVLSGLVYFFGVVIPMSIALIRVYAAQLPEDETPVVPFDRTFGGLVVSEAEGGKGKLMLKEAWKSFDWNGRVRLIKVWVKMIIMLFMATVALFAGLAALGGATYRNAPPEWFN